MTQLLTTTTSPEPPHCHDTTDACAGALIQRFLQRDGLLAASTVLAPLTTGSSAGTRPAENHTHNNVTNTSGSSYILAVQTTYLRDTSPDHSKSRKPNDTRRRAVLHPSV